MRKSFLISLFFWGVLFAFSPAPGLAAEKVITARDSDAILNMAKGYGSASLDKDSDGDPLLTGKINGTSYNIHFYGCTNGSNCESIQFATGWSKDVKIVSLEEANAWNRKKRFVTAFTNTDGLILLRMDVMLRFDMDEKNLDIYFEIWKSIMNEFQRDVLK